MADAHRVFSPCGRYVVRWMNEGRQVSLCVCERPTSSSVPNDPLRTFSTVLDDAATQKLTAANGVKPFEVFCQMLHAALVGSSDVVSYSVITYQELQLLTREEEDTNGADSVAPVPDVRFLMVDYTVAFTRAVYPIRLTEVPLDNSTPPDRQTSRRNASTKESDRSDHPSSAEDKVKTLLQETLVENQRLKEENLALRRVTDEELRAMQRESQRLEAVVSRSEVGKLRKDISRLRIELDEKNVEVRRLKRELDRAQADARRAALDASRRSTGSRDGTGRSKASPSRTASRQSTPPPRQEPPRRGRFDTPPTRPRPLESRRAGTTNSRNVPSSPSSIASSRQSTPSRRYDSDDATRIRSQRRSPVPELSSKRTRSPQLASDRGQQPKSAESSTLSFGTFSRLSQEKRSQLRNNVSDYRRSPLQKPSPRSLYH